MPFGKVLWGEEKVAQARLAALENFPKIQRDDWVALRKFLDALELYAQSGPFDPYPHSRENVMTMTLIKRRMPSPWYQKFVTWCLEHDKACIPSNFLHWANNRVDPHLLEISFANNNAKRNVSFITAEDFDLGENTLNVVNVSSSDVCVKCGGGHTVKHWEKFYLMQPVERKDLIVSAGRCLCCLGLGHRYEQCYSKARCPICAGKHHLLVHVPAEGASSSEQPTYFGYCSPNVTVCYKSGEVRTENRRNPDAIDSREHLISTAFAVVALRNPVMQKTVLVNALCDSGTNNSTNICSCHGAAPPGWRSRKIHYGGIRWGSKEVQYKVLFPGSR